MSVRPRSGVDSIDSREAQGRSLIEKFLCEYMLTKLCIVILIWNHDNRVTSLWSKSHRNHGQYLMDYYAQSSLQTSRAGWSSSYCTSEKQLGFEGYHLIYCFSALETVRFAGELKIRQESWEFLSWNFIFFPKVPQLFVSEQRGNCTCWRA